MKSGKDIILEHCNTIKTHDIDHLQSCLDVAREINDGKDKDPNWDFSSCPSSYGLDEWEGLCFEEEVKGLKAQSEQCCKCWRQAFETEFKR